MINKWVHVNFMGGDPWVLPIWEAFKEGEKKSYFPPKSKDMSELSIHISTRLNMIPWVIRRINLGWNELKNIFAQVGEEYISTHNKQGYAYTFEDKIIYNLVVDIDSFLFEIDSCCELMSTFIRKIYQHIGKFSHH